MIKQIQKEAVVMLFCKLTNFEFELGVKLLHFLLLVLTADIARQGGC